MLETVQTALAVYRPIQNAWQALMRNGMAQDYSWPNSAREYVKVYERARQIRAAAVG